MNRVTDVVIRIDYKMKLLSILYRESMAQFFGKRGIAFTRFKTPAELAAVTDFGNGLTDDSKEDAWAALRALIAAMRKYKARNHWISRSHIISDVAGVFSGTAFWVMLFGMGLYTGIFVMRHFVTEAGCGKSFLDGHFSYALKFLCHVCADGRGTIDVQCASDAVHSYTHFAFRILIHTPRPPDEG
jgi:hypothetical protein